MEITNDERKRIPEENLTAKNQAMRRMRVAPDRSLRGEHLQAWIRKMFARWAWSSKIEESAMTPNERFAKAAGICWNNEIGWSAEEVLLSVGDKQYKAQYKIRHINPDFTDAREVLKVMEREDWNFFSAENCLNDVDTLIEFIIDRTGKLRDLATEWMEAHNG